MSNKFITNQGELLSNVINDILPSSEKLHFLVGFFYFSGFEQLYKNLTNHKIRILVGLDIEKDIFNKIKEFEIIESINMARGKIRNNYYRSLVELFNDTDYFDSNEKQEAFKLFLKKLKDGTLIIKKTVSPNHAKLYIFENKPEFSQGGRFPGTIITGSSNLSYSGLTNQQEINVLFRDEHYNEGKELFDKLWGTAVDIAGVDNMEEFLSQVVEKIWLDKLYKPFLLYVRVLVEYFSLPKVDSIILPAEITKNKYLNLKYQIDAIEQTIAILEKHGGVLVADVVGMGKSIIASTVAHNLGKKVVIIVPPHLIDQWREYRWEYGFNAKIYSSGKIESAVLENLDEEECLIIIDEAHKYRNEATKDYGNLHKLCQGNKVILLTATPYNNRPQDIFSMIKLFQIPSKSTIQTVDNLAFQFKELVKEYKSIYKSQKEKTEDETTIKNRIEILTKTLRHILSPLIIRRSRIDLNEIEEYSEDLDKQKIKLPTVEDPILLEYKLGELSDLYQETLEKIAPDDEEKGFIGARYKPSFYLKDFKKYIEKLKSEFGDENLFRQSQINLAMFMRHLLVRRFESSIFAFRVSLDKMISSSQNIKDWYEKLGRVPIYKKGKLPDIEALFGSNEAEVLQELDEIDFTSPLERYKEKGLHIIDAKEIKKSFIEDINKDIQLLTEIRDEWFGSGQLDDPKLDHIKQIILDQLKKDPKRKIILFTEFADTANYIYEEIKEELPRAFKYSSGDATKTNKKIIKDNFDASLEERKQENEYDLLIATDAISEGFNLHRAGTVFNYDIPYNPTRVIQRVGRINRIAKKVFDKLYIYNFFPTKTGEEETRIRQISTLKITMIHALLGEDTKVLTTDEELTSYFKERYEREFKLQEEKSWDVEYRNILNQLKSAEPDIIEEARKVPKRSRIRRTVKKDNNGVIVFGKKGAEHTFKLGTSADNCIALNAEDALKIFQAEINEDADKVSVDFEPIYNYVKSNLFKRKTQVTSDKAKVMTTQKIDVLKELLPVYKDYLEDLLYVVKELDSLPDYYARKIRAIDEQSLEKDLKSLTSELPHSYIINIIGKAQSIEEGVESLILAEELI